jgi:putrescine aminotransferase
LATIAAVATIDVMKEEDLPLQAREKGEKLLSGLKELVSAYDGVVASVRGKGLMIGVEMADEGYGIPMMSFLMEEGVIVAYALNNPKVIRLEPPLIISYEEIDKVLDAWNNALKKMKSFVDSL